MQDDLLHEVRMVYEADSAKETSKFYSKHALMPMCTIVQNILYTECPNDHPYLIGDVSFIIMPQGVATRVCVCVCVCLSVCSSCNCSTVAMRRTN